MNENLLFLYVSFLHFLYVYISNIISDEIGEMNLANTIYTIHINQANINLIHGDKNLTNYQCEFVEYQLIFWWINLLGEFNGLEKFWNSLILAS